MMIAPPNRTNTTQGTNIETMLHHVLLDHPRAFGKIKAVAGIPAQADPVKDADNIGMRKRKTDIVFAFGGDYPLLRISVKSFKKAAGYNHLERKSLDKFCTDNRLRAADAKMLHDMFIRKAVEGKAAKAKDKSASKKITPLVYPSERDDVRRMFANVEVGASAFLGSDHPQILAVFRIDDNRWHFYDMQNQVLPNTRQSHIGFTARGGANIQLGDYILLQRKGSEKGEHSYGLPISDIRHRSNDVQIKFRLKAFFDEIEPLAYIQL